MGNEPLKFTNEQLNNFEKWWQQMSKKIEVSDVAGPPRITPPWEGDTVRFRPTLWPAPPENLQNNLQKYRKLALDNGAEDAKIVPTREIPQDIRALYVTCFYPSCRWLNTNFHCPMVRTFPIEEMTELVSDYQYAIVFKLLPPVFDSVPDAGKINLDMYYTMGGGEPPDKTMLARNIVRLRILSEMERRLRAAAYYDGHLMAAPVGSGPCLLTKCADVGKCSALKPGGYCRTMGVQPAGPGCAYIDYFELGKRLGWGQLQVGGNCAFPEDSPNSDGYYNIGLVLIE